jgi:sugar lactone lactonase YvrE
MTNIEFGQTKQFSASQLTAWRPGKGIVAWILAAAAILVGTALSGAAPAGATEPEGGSAGAECASIPARGIEKQMNLEASKILVTCGVLAGGSSAGPSSSPSSVLGPAFPGSDVDVITGTETFPRVTQSESFGWSHGSTVVVSYNDARGDEESPVNLSGVSVSKNGGETFTRLGPPSPFTGHEANKGDPIVVYNEKLGKWFAGDLAAGCGGKGIGLWTSTNGETWTVGACAHNGTGDDRESMWVDNNPASPHYGRMYVSINNFSVSEGALQVTHSDDGTTWSTPVTLFSGPGFRRDVQLTGSPGTDGTVFLPALNENGGGVGNTGQQNYMFRSTNGGETWTSTTIGGTFTNSGSLSCGYFAAIPPIWRQMGWGQPAVGPNGVVMYDYAAHGEGSDEADIFLVRSTNNGETWSAPVRLNTDSSGKAQWMPSLRVSPSGVVEASWYDRRNTTNGENYQRFARISTNNGATWGPDEPLSTVLIPQPTQPDPKIQACYAGDYNYTTASTNTGFDTWTDGRVSIEGKPVQKVFFHSIHLQAPPTVTTGSATGITETGATLHGTVNPEGSETKYYFEYGTTKSFGSKTAEASAGSGTTNVEVSKVLTTLTGGTTYFYRIVATNTGGTSFGAEKTFETTAKPTVETKAATSVGETTAKLNGIVNPKGAETKYYFEYGTTEAYGSKTAEASAGSGFTNIEVNKEITGLLRNTTYNFRIVATNINGTTNGANQKLTTLSSVITGSATGITATEAVVHGTINPHGLATTDQFEYGLTTSYGTTVPVPAESAGSGTTVVGKGYILTGLQPSTTYHFRLVEINSEGNTFGKDAIFTTTALSAEFVGAFGSFGTGNGQFNEPTGIGVNPINGNVVVSDEKNNRVQVFNEKQEFVRTFGTEGTGNGQFKEPRGVAVDSKGNIWVTDTGNNRVEEFNEKGEYLSQFGTTGTGNGQFTSPKGLGVDTKGNIWVADSGNNRVEEFNEKREYVRQFSAGTNPIGVVADAKGNIWSDNENETGAIEEHNEKGELLQKFATRGSGNGQVLNPKRLAIDTAGDLWVPSAGNNRVDVFNEKGEYVTKFGSAGSGSEQMKDPTGVAVDHSGNVWVADDENNRVDKWIR